MKIQKEIKCHKMLNSKEWFENSKLVFLIYELQHNKFNTLLVIF